MAELDDHPTVRQFRAQARPDADAIAAPPAIAADDIRALADEAGADDVGFVRIERTELDDQRDDVLAFFPGTRTLVSFVVRMNRENVRRPSRSIANLEFHHATDDVNEISRRVVAELERRGIAAATGGAAGFPMETSRWGLGKMWDVSHKPIAVAAGLGRIGIHRNVIHPKFGNHILLGTILIAADVDREDRPLDYNPCLECKLCVAACPTGAIKSDGGFDFSACFTHNYREFMGGFADWVDTVASGADAYARETTPAETVSMWQSLAFGPNYKAAYCMAVCPAGEDVIGPFLTDRKRFLDDVLKPLRDKEETVYVVAGSDAEVYVAERFPHKTIKHVSNGLVTGMASVKTFLTTLPIGFASNKAKGVDVVYHFEFFGDETASGTVTIRDQKIVVEDGLVGRADLRIVADSATWLAFLRKQSRLPWALLRGKIRLHGNPRHMLVFAKCFPS